MNYILINFFIYLLLWLFFSWRIKRFNLFMIVWSGYTLSSLMSYISVIGNYYYYPVDFAYKVSSLGVLLSVLAINLIISIPFMKVDERKIRLSEMNMDLPIVRYFVQFSVPFFIIVSIMRIYEVTAIETVISYGDLYDMVNDEDSTTLLRDLLYSNTFLKMLSGVGGRYCTVMAPFLLLYFFNKIAKDRKITFEYILCMIFAVIPVVLQGVTIASRGSLFFSLAELFFFYYIIKSYISKRIRKIIIFVSIFFIFVMSGLFLSITESRVETRRSLYSSFEDIMIYAGQPMLNACYFHDRIHYHPMGKRILDIRESNGKQMVFREYWNLKTGCEVQLFKTYYGDLYLEFGLLLAFVFTIVYTLLWNMLVIKKYKKAIYLPFLYYYFHILIFSYFNFDKLKWISIWTGLLILICLYISSSSRVYSISRMKI